jgi:ActR/RegA family two-component response regulator
MKLLIVEDDGFRVRFFIERFGQYDLKVIENAKVAIEYLQENVFDYIFLDNDLGEGNGEGVDVADYLAQHPDNPNNEAIVIVHSWNVPATAAIKSKLPNAVAAPFNTDNFLSLRLDI